MNKKDRQTIFNKYGGRCAYCGCELQKGWHVDEIEPIIRNWTYVRDTNGYDTKKKYTGCQHPERMRIENQNPSCGSCNRQKHSQSLEGFRQSIAQFVNSLNSYHNQYKFAKRYGLVVETGNPVVFYFETVHSLKQKEG